MKYKKLLVLVTCLLFVTVAVFCLASAFKVTDIELNVESVENSPENVSSLCGEELIKYDGANLLFLSVDKIKDGLSNLSGYVEVIDVKKEFPNKISVTVKERVEAFTIFVNDKYYALDSSFTVLSEKQSNVNNVSGIENVLIEFSLSDVDTNLKVGKSLKIFDDATATYLKNSATALSDIKGSLQKLSVSVRKDGVSYKTLTLKMKEGVVINLLKADEMTVEKLNATYEFYLALENKGFGEYITVLEDNGKITVKL